MNNKKLLAIAVTIVAAISNLKAETLSIFDDTFTVTGLPVGSVSTILSGRWGTWNVGTATFVQAVTSDLNSGFVDLSGPELGIAMNQTSNAIYSVGTQMALAIFAKTNANDSQLLNWTSTGVSYGAVLTDASWVAPTFQGNANFVDFIFSTGTVAQVGSYSYGGGNETIGLANLSLSAIPEPSVASLLALGTVGLVALRVRRKS
jgi:hypothetical protein